WLAIAIFVNCLAQVPYVLIQSAGRPDISTMIQIAELPFYLTAVWLLTRRLGMEGAAIAWSCRAVIDAALMFSFAQHLVPRSRQALIKLASSIVVGVLVLALATVPITLITKGMMLASLMLLLAFGVWAFGFDPDDKIFIRGIMRPSGSP